MRTQDALTVPLSTAQITERLEPDGTVSGTVRVSLKDLVSLDHEDVLDLLSTRLTGSPLLLNIEHRLAGAADDGTDDVLVHVTGDPSAVLADSDADTGGLGV